MSSRRVTRAEGLNDRQIRAAVALMVVILGLILLMWAWGALAAASGGHGPPASVGESWKAAPRVLFHLDDPAAAWGAQRSQLPGPGGMWASLLVLVVAALVAIVLVGTVARARKWNAPGILKRSGRFAEWAKLSDLRPLMVQPDKHPGRVALGTFKDHLLAAGEEASVLIVGATRSGKTAGALIPALLEHDGPVIATSVKEDLLLTLPWRRSQGEVRIFDPTGAVDETTAGWSPVLAARDWRSARRTAHRLLHQGGVANQKDHDFWLKSGVRLLAPLMLAAHVDEGGMELVLEWLESGEQEEVEDALERHAPAAEAARALSQIRSVWGTEERTRSSIVSTIAAGLEPYQDPEVLANELTQPITPEWLLAGKNTVYVIAPAHEQERLRGVLVAMLTDLIDGAYVHAARQPDNRLASTLLLAFDEVANIASLPDLDGIASTGAGAGIKLVSGVQNVAQLQERWGKDKAETILANHVARVFAGGIADEAGLNYLRTVAGEEEVDSVSRSQGGTMGGQTSYGTTFRPLIDGPVARQTREFSALLIYGRLPPARISLRPWFLDERLRSRVERDADDEST
jgi:type IV secretion system protein VirD4